MRHSTLGFLASCILLAGCMAGPEPAPPPPPGSDVVAVTREFLPSATAIGTTYVTDVPTAYLLLSPDQKKSGRRLCEAWMYLPTTLEAGQDNPNAKFARTYWLLGSGSSESDTCKKLVDKYDYAKADRFRSSFGLPLGSLLAVHFPDNRTFYVDLTRASAKQDRDVLLSWYRVASTSDKPGETVQSASVAARMHRAICDEDSTIVGTLVQSAAGLLGPFGFVVGVGKEELCKTVVV